MAPAVTAADFKKFQQEMFAKFQGFESKLNEIMTTPTETAETNDTISALKEDFLQFKKSIFEQMSRMSTERHEIEQTQRQQASEIDNLQQYSRRNCLLVHGVQDIAKEDAMKTVLTIFNTQLKINLPHYVMDRAHRIGSQSDKRPIIVKFTSYQPRDAIWRAKRALKGTGIVITESLTKHRQAIFKTAREKYGKHNCWTADGRIYAINEAGKKIQVSLDNQSVEV